MAAGAVEGEVRKLGEVVHVFSHVRQTMSVEWHRVVLPERPELPAPPPRAEAEGAAVAAEEEKGEEEKAAQEAEGAAKGKGKGKGKAKGKGKKGASGEAEEGAVGAGAGGPREFRWVELGSVSKEVLETLTSGQRKVWALVAAAKLDRAGGGAGPLEKLWGAAAAKK